MGAACMATIRCVATLDKVVIQRTGCFARLPEAVAVFASRARRSGIMIGKALSNHEIDKIVKSYIRLIIRGRCGALAI